MPLILILLCILTTLDLNHDGIADIAGIDLCGLDDLVAGLGITVVLGKLPPGWWGAFCGKKITMREGLTSAQFRSVLAHELGHAYLNHCGGYSDHDSAHERAADRFAATSLISVEDARAALEACGPDRIALARYVDVMPWVVREYGQTAEGQAVLSDYMHSAKAPPMPACDWDGVTDRFET